ncbi:MAG TPA: dTMP kinase, partial [Niabella sp.]|nr:dTMP kinase [Niabella sp.]
MTKNLFIAFEGIDGSGKSTQVKLLSQRLEAEGHKVYATFEPTDSRIG